MKGEGFSKKKKKKGWKRKQRESSMVAVGERWLSNFEVISVLPQH